MNLAAIFKKFLSGQETGQLVVKFADAQHLCKISIDNGAAVYITLGTMGPDETLDFIADKQALQANFIEGVPARKKLDTSLNNRLFAIAGATGGASPSQPQPSVSHAAGGGAIPAQKVQAAIEDFIDLVGPLGTVMAENALSSFGYTKGSGMDESSFSSFLDEIKGEIPKEQQQAFLGRHLK